MSHDNALPTWYIVETKAINFVMNQEATEKKKNSFKDFEKFYNKILEKLK